jgi:hypothetical protein
MKSLIIVSCVVLLFSCQKTFKPTMISGKGAISGTIETRAHSDMIAKTKKAADDDEEDYSASGKIVYSDAMVNYDKLDDIYVGLIGSGSDTKSVVDVIVTEDGFEPRAVAISTGDRIRIFNATPNSLTFYAADLNSDDVEEFAPMAAGARGEITVSLEGLLEIAADERDDLIATVLSQRGMRVRRVTSGETYLFNNLTPGDYRMVFWYWRLGMLERSTSVKASKVTEVNEYLSVDRMFRD